MTIPIKSIGKRMIEQDNRATAHPIFAVQQRVRLYGFTLKYKDDKYVWLDTWDYSEATEEEAKELDQKELEGEEIDGWLKTGYQDRWEFVTACFSEQGCKDYLKVNGHNLTDPRIFVYSAHRNAEWQAVREHLLEEGKTTEE